MNARSRFVLDPALVKENIDENTIGVFVIMGSTYTGKKLLRKLYFVSNHLVLVCERQYNTVKSGCSFPMIELELMES